MFSRTPPRHERFRRRIDRRCSNPMAGSSWSFPMAGTSSRTCEFDTDLSRARFLFLAHRALAACSNGMAWKFSDVERLTIHGGSLRLFAGHRGAHPVRTLSAICSPMRNAQGRRGLGLLSKASRITSARIREDLLRLLRDLKSQEEDHRGLWCLGQRQHAAELSAASAPERSTSLPTAAPTNRDVLRPACICRLFRRDELPGSTT